MLESNRFIFLNEEGSLSGPESWNDASRSKLWLYNAHYFNDLNAVDASERKAWHRALIQCWVEDNPPTSGNGWEPYPSSLRIVNWVKWALQGNEMEAAWLDSLATQTRFLRKRLEYHLLGNHLFANAKALVFAGLFFSGDEAEEWLRKGLAILTREVPEQILADGGHFERSPMYHAIILEDLLDLVNLFAVYGVGTRHPGVASSGVAGPEFANDTRHPGAGSSGVAGPEFANDTRHPGAASSGVAEPEFANDARHPGAASSGTRDPYNDAGITGLISAAIPKMFTWLQTMTHPDGEIGFFNDATLGIATNVAGLERYADRLGLEPPLVNPEGLVQLPQSGFVRIAQGAASALLDVGEIGPDYLPGHAHADTLSFELSLFGQRCIVNSGISTYGDGSERLRQRGTAAHSTVEIDGENSSEVWGGFRVARRARPFGLSIRESDKSVSVTCSHDGYKRLKGKPLHTRQWLFEPGRMVVTDHIQGPFQQAVAYFHLHPDVSAGFGDGECNGWAQVDGRYNAKWSVTGGQVSIEDSAYHPEFGLSIANQVIKVVFTGADAVFTLAWGAEMESGSSPE